MNDVRAADRGRGRLRVYLAVAPGAGATWALLDEAERRRGRGRDVVLAGIQTHGRRAIGAKLAALDADDAPAADARRSTCDLDVTWLLRRRPQVACVDELAAAGSDGTTPRWRDVDRLLDAGIDVVSTVRVSEIESLSDLAASVSGAPASITVPDAWLRTADVELVDITPDALERRLAHGNLTAPDGLDASRARLFRPEVVSGLRDLALRWLAEGVEERLRRLGAPNPAGPPERVVVGLTGAPSGDALLRRAARIAAQGRAELVGVHVTTAAGGPDGASPPDAALAAQRRLLATLGGQFHEIAAVDVPSGLAGFVQTIGATQLVIGGSPPPRAPAAGPGRGRAAARRAGASVAAVELARRLGGVDLHVIATSAAPDPALPAARIGPAVLSARRRIVAGATAAVALVLLTTALVHLGSGVGLPTVLLLYLTIVVAAAAGGGLVPGIAAAVAATLLANWFFTPPQHTLTIADADDLTALIVFVGVAAVVSLLVHLSATRARDAERSRRAAEALATAASSVSASDPLSELLTRLVATLHLDGASLLRRSDRGWETIAATGADAPANADSSVTAIVPGHPSTYLACSTVRVDDDTQVVLRGFAEQASVALTAGELRAAAANARTIAAADELRTAILRAVSHDLRTPLSTIKAAATSLLQTDVEIPPADRTGLLQTIDGAADRLDRVVGNLLDLSRLQVGAVHLDLRRTALEDVVAGALAGIAHDPGRVEVDVPVTVPEVLADPALIERSVANLVSNALAWSPPDRPVRVDAALVDGAVHLRVIDRGPGIPADRRADAFAPFQRLGDRSHDAGVGLGLAVAKGFVDAMGGLLLASDTPGGGLTVTLVLPAHDPERRP